MTGSKPSSPQYKIDEDKTSGNEDKIKKYYENHHQKNDNEYSSPYRRKEYTYGPRTYRSRTCRYWLQGHCRLGDNCTYVHGIVPNAMHHPRLNNLYHQQPPPPPLPPSINISAGGSDHHSQESTDQHSQHSNDHHFRYPNQFSSYPSYYNQYDTNNGSSTTIYGILPPPPTHMQHHYYPTAHPYVYHQYPYPFHHQFNGLNIAASTYLLDGDEKDHVDGVSTVENEKIETNNVSGTKEMSGESDLNEKDAEQEDTEFETQDKSTRTEPNDLKKKPICDIQFGEMNMRTPEISVPIKSLDSPLTLKSKNKQVDMDQNNIVGLQNENGENNCFINVVLQALYHSQKFLKSFLAIKHNCGDDSKCIYCALKKVFISLKNSKIISTQKLRLLTSFTKGSMDDAAEALEYVLSSLHECLSSHGEYLCEYSKITCYREVGRCIVHDMFGMYINQTAYCNKCETSIPSSEYETKIIYIAVDLLLKNIRKNPNIDLNDLLKYSFVTDSKRCPNNNIDSNEKSKSNSKFCINNKLIVSQISLLRIPKIITFGLSWSSIEPSTSSLKSIMSVIKENIEITNIFDNKKLQDKIHLNAKLIGIICYFGRHYITFSFSQDYKKWYSFNDEVVKEIGTDLSSVILECIKVSYQPLILFYETEESQNNDRKKNPNIHEFYVGNVVVPAVF